MTDYWRGYDMALAFAGLSLWRRAIKKPLKTLAYYAACRVCKGLAIAPEVHAQTFFRERMLVVFPEGMSRQIFYYGGVEEDVTYFLLRHLREGMAFVDVGAHVGYFTLLASKLVGDSGCVHAFEPSESTFEILKKNTSGKTNIKINRKGLLSMSAIMSFNDYGSQYSALNGFMRPRIFREEDIETRRVYSVECVSLDQYCVDFNVIPDFIKIDAESSELDILLGSKNTIDAHNPLISLEVGDINMLGAKKSRECILFLIERGYDVFEYVSQDIVPHKVRNSYEYKNLLFIPSRRS